MSKEKPLQVSFGGRTLDGVDPYVLVSGDNNWSGGGSLHSDLKDRLNRIQQSEKKVNYVRLFQNDEFFIDTEGSDFFQLRDFQCAVALKEELKKPGKVEDVALSADYYSYMVIRENNFVCNHYVDKELHQALLDFYKEQHDLIHQRHEATIREEILRKRKHSSLESSEDVLASEARARPLPAETNDSCVLCQDDQAVMAMVPCGHVCLCKDCSDTYNSVGHTGSTTRRCPLCRGNIQSTLRIYIRDAS
jgi:hypothetical protein